MKKRLLEIGIALVIALAALSCSSVQYFGPTDHVDYRDTDHVKASSQSVLTASSAKDLKTTYDEEYTYDNNGNLLKTKTTEYFDLHNKNHKYVVWETESKILGGKLVPYKVSANGIPFIEIEYDLMTVAGNGAIREAIKNRRLNIRESSFFSGIDYKYMEFSLDNYSVSFPADDKFVSEISRFNYRQGVSYENVLTLGYDNIVLKRFSISPEKLAEGISKSYSGYNYGSDILRRWAAGKNIEYNYEWKVIGGRICETKMSYKTKTINLEANQDYDGTGRRTKETWFVSDPRKSKGSPIKIFEQTLTY